MGLVAPAALLNFVGLVCVVCSLLEYVVYVVVPKMHMLPLLTEFNEVTCESDEVSLQLVQIHSIS